MQMSACHHHAQARYHTKPLPSSQTESETSNHILPRSRNLTGTSTNLALRNSAVFFPRKSYVLVQLTPRSRCSRRRKCTALSPGNSNRSMALPFLYSGPRSSRILPTLSTLRSQSYSAPRCRTQKPTLQSLPLSPDRACTIQPSGARTVRPQGPKTSRSMERPTWAGSSAQPPAASVAPPRVRGAARRAAFELDEGVVGCRGG